MIHTIVPTPRFDEMAYISQSDEVALGGTSSLSYTNVVPLRALSREPRALLGGRPAVILQECGAPCWNITPDSTLEILLETRWGLRVNCDTGGVGK